MVASRLLALLTLTTLSMSGYAQTYNLSETPKPGDCNRISIETGLSGSMKVAQDGKVSTIKLAAKSDHILLERVLAVDKNSISKAARYYEKATSQAEVGDEKTPRTLRSDRRLLVAQCFDDAPLCYSPAGPLTRAELEVVSEHFDTLHLTGLLPETEVAIAETWKISNSAVQSLCLFEGLISHDLTGKLAEVKEGQAIIIIAGSASGVELGAAVKLEIKASARFDLLNRRLVSLEWKQKDVREQGPASPASELESMTELKRTFLADEPKELTKAALIGVPAENDPPELLKQLQFKDTRGRFGLLHSRDWRLVGQTEHHVVLRLLERGDFVAQATITVWTKESAGKHSDPDEFKKSVAGTPGWNMEEIMEAGEVPTDDGRWIYRVMAKGDLEGAKVVQTFYLMAGPQGDQLAVTFTMKPANAAKIGTRDLAIVNAIEFLKK